MITSTQIPQANDPTRIIALARHWTRHGVGTWPPSFQDGRDRHYYRHALQTLGAITPDNAPTDRLSGLASAVARVSQAAFASGLRESSVGRAWLKWQGGNTLAALQRNDAERFLSQASDLSDSTARRRASTLKQWLDWCLYPLPARFQDALDLALQGIDLGSRKANKFEQARNTIARQLSISPEMIGIKKLTDQKNYGNRISEATHLAPMALMLIGPEDLDVQAVVRAYTARAVTRPPTLLIKPSATGWLCVCVVLGDERIPDVFPAEIERISPNAQTREETLSSRDIDDAVELLLALKEQPRAVLDAVLHELPPRLRRSCLAKRVSSSKQVYNRVAEAIGRRPQLLLLTAPAQLELALERAVEQVIANHNAPVRVLFALFNDSRFSVRESIHTASREEREEPVTTSVARAAPHVKKAGTIDWRSAGYTTWNERLLDYVFAADEIDEPVRRIAATPEELQRAVGDPEADPQEVVESFRRAFCAEIPRGRTTLDRETSSHWPVGYGEIPHFFGMLWMTCLICWGYPSQNDGSFADRLTLVLGRITKYQKLNEIWLRLARWLEDASGYRRLELPEPDSLRKIIGRSYFLAFPHGNDRNKLSALLAEAGLVGRYLPVTKTLATLMDNIRGFSAHFQSDLIEFKNSWSKGNDPANSAFWRAVQQEAMNPSHSQVSREARATLIARDEEEVLQLYLAWPADKPPPRGMMTEVDSGLDDLNAVMLIDASGDPAEIANAQVAYPTLLDPSTVAALSQGVLLFAEIDDWEYRLVTGDVSQTRMALVRDDRVEPFVAAFGGQTAPAVVPGWTEVQHAVIVASAEAPSGLEEVDQLCISAMPPRPRFCHGVRVPGGHLGLKNSLPMVRAIGALEVTATFVATGGKPDFERGEPCIPLEDGLWKLPDGLVQASACPGDVHVQAVWEIWGPTGVRLRRTGSDQTHLWKTAGGWQYKSPAGPRIHYWQESIAAPMRTIIGGIPIDSAITTRDPTEAADLLEFDGTRRFLGPGCGEIAAQPQPGFDWMAMGGWKKPDWLVFVGDTNAPTPLDNGYSENNGDRRHWRSAFNDMRRVRVRTPAGYELPDEHPLVAKEFRRRRASTRNTRPPRLRREVLSDPALLSLQTRHHPKSEEPSSDDLWGAIEHVAAIAQRRQGVTGKEFQQIALALLGRDDFLLANEIRRTWEEAGAIDVLFRQDRANIIVVPRRPRFLLVRDGPRIVGLLHGLIPKVLDTRLQTTVAATGTGLEHGYRPRVARDWTPPMPLVWADSEEIFRTLSDRLELGSPLWMAWPSDGPPTYLDASRTAALAQDEPPDYKVDATWDWLGKRFMPLGKNPSEIDIVVERRRHALQSPVYVVHKSDKRLGWTRSSNWVLLEAWRHRPDSPFVVHEDGATLVSLGHAPVHLPLPLARVCAILGDACPGPIVTRGHTEYHYPLGSSLWRAFERLLPRHWTSVKT